VNIIQWVMMMMKVRNFTVEAVPRSTIQSFVHKNHYSGSTNGVQHTQCFALFKEGKFGFDKHIIGAAIYAIPSMPATAAKYNPDNPLRCWELRRLCCIDDTPKNTESYFISQCHKWIKQNTNIEVIVSFADLQHGHNGIIYQASNFHYLGQTGKAQVLMVDGKEYHSRSMNQAHKPYSREIKRRYKSGDENIYFKERKPKNIYVYYLNKKIKKKFFKKNDNIFLPYPKD
jgi:hypothetical protein